MHCLVLSIGLGLAILSAAATSVKWASPTSIPGFKKYINDSATFKSKQQIICLKCWRATGYMCVFPQHLKKTDLVTGALVKEKMARLLEHKCDMCGSCPVFPGNNVNTGEVTVNYQAHGCKNADEMGYCPGAKG